MSSQSTENTLASLFALVKERNAALEVLRTSSEETRVQLNNLNYFKGKLERGNERLSWIRYNLSTEINKQRGHSERMSSLMGTLVIQERDLVQAQNNVCNAGNSYADALIKLKKCRFFGRTKLQQRVETTKQALLACRRIVDEAVKTVKSTRVHLSNTQKEYKKVTGNISVLVSDVKAFEQYTEECKIFVSNFQDSYNQAYVCEKPARETWENLDSRLSREITTYISSHVSVIEACQLKTVYSSKKASLEKQISDCLEDVKAANPVTVVQIEEYEMRIQKWISIRDYNAPSHYAMDPFGNDCYIYYDNEHEERKRHDEALNKISSYRRFINELQNSFLSDPEYLSLQAELTSLKCPNVDRIKETIRSSILKLTPPPSHIPII